MEVVVPPDLVNEVGEAPIAPMEQSRPPGKGGVTSALSSDCVKADINHTSKTHAANR